MLIIGELINSSRKAVAPGIENQDTAMIQQLACQQIAKGANYLDVNCGTFVSREPEQMAWLVQTIQNAVAAPLCIDSPNPVALERGLQLCQHGQPIINSVTAEQQRLASILPLITKYHTKIIALCMGDCGIPQTVQERLAIADILVTKLRQADVADEDIYLDPLVQPIATSSQTGMAVLNTIKAIKNKYPAVHTVCGLSNISYGLPNRAVLNRAFLLQTMTCGMDAYILNPTDDALMGVYWAGNAILGNDNYCSNYLKAHRQGLYK